MTGAESGGVGGWAGTFPPCGQRERTDRSGSIELLEFEFLRLESLFCRVVVELPAGGAVFGGNCFATEVLALEFDSGTPELNSVVSCALELMESCEIITFPQN